MSTRGFLGIRNNNELIDGKFNHWDSYYDALGQEVLDLYYNDKGQDILSLSEDGSDISFFYDALFCEYSYIYNTDNDTLEIYRGYFKKKQELKELGIKEKIVEALEPKDKETYFQHLILVIDKKKHLKNKVIDAFKKYDGNDDEEKYPERGVIPLEVPEGYVMIV